MYGAVVNRYAEAARGKNMIKPTTSSDSTIASMVGQGLALVSCRSWRFSTCRET